nr:tRNA-dihydrouridine synthase [bacterium]
FQAPEFTRMAADEGVDFITVHGRYRTSYTVPADWNRIAEVKASAGIPVIGNGDILSVEDACEMMRVTGCDGVMVARGILGNPWLPRRIYQALTSGIIPPEPTLQERFHVFSRHLDYLIALKGERRAGLIFRKHAAWYLKGFPNIARFRRTLFTFTRPEQFYGAIQEMLISYGIPLDPR